MSGMLVIACATLVAAASATLVAAASATLVAAATATSPLQRETHFAAAGGVQAAFPWGSVSLLPWGSGIRMRAAPPDGSIVDPSIMALLPSPLSPTPGIRFAAAALSLVVDDLTAAVDPVSGWVTFSRVSTGVLLLQQVGVDWGAAANASRPGSVSATVRFAGLAPGERVYGLGEHPASPTVGMTSFSSDWALENNGVMTIPWFVSSLGYGLLWNVPAFGTVNISARGHDWHAVATLNADLWIAASAATAPLPMAEVLSRYADVVGHAQPMPHAASGVWHSKNRYRNSTQLEAVAAGFASRGLPLSVLVIDYMSWPVLGDDYFSPACWPDPAGMLARITAMHPGVQLLISFYPYQNTGSSHYDEFVGGGLSAVDLTGAVNSYAGCLSGQTLYDAFNPAARAATFGAWTAGYGKYGISWAWEDCSEPGRNLARNGRWHFTAGTDSEVGPAWTREHARTMFEGNTAAAAAVASGDVSYSATAPVASAGAAAPLPFVTLSRSFYPGSASLGAALWSGDVATTFASLHAQVRVAQSAAMSGVHLWSSDTGGYQGGNASDPAWRELIVRWAQFSAVCPLMRFHGKRLGGDATNTQCGPTNGDNEPWEFGDTAFSAISRMWALREDLRPYVEAASALTAATGMPMLRPLALAFPFDPAASTPFSEAAFMFGPSLLASPVTVAGAVTATVYLPRLANTSSAWTYYFDRARVWPGGGLNHDVSVGTPLDEFPLFELTVSPGGYLGAAPSVPVR